MEYCKNCANGDFSRFVPPIGDNKPDVYFVGDTPRGDESLVETDLILNQFILDAIIDKYRRFNTVACRCVSEQGRDRKPTLEEVSNCVQMVTADIIKTRPNVIVFLGMSVLKAFVPDYEGTMAQAMRHMNLNIDGIPVVLGYHPSYISKRGGIASSSYTEEFVTPLKTAINRVLYPDQRSDNVEYEIITPLDIERLFTELNDPEIALDLEAISLDVLSSGYRLLGIGLASRTKSFYLLIEAFGVNYQKEYQQIIPRLREYLKRRERILVYNLSYEGKALYKELLIIPNYWDVYSDVKVLGKTNSLKEMCFLELGIPDWGDDVWHVANLLGDIVKTMKPTAKGESRYAREMKEHRIPGLIANYSPEILAKNSKKLQLFISNIKQLSTFYTPEEILIVEETLFKRSSSLILEPVMELVKADIMAEYCVKDTKILFELRDKLVERMTDREIDVARSVFQAHARLGVTLETNSLAWDDAYADELEEFYSTELISLLKQFVGHPMFYNTHKFNELKIYKFTTLKTGKIRYSKIYNPPKRENTYSCDEMTVRDILMMNDMGILKMLFNPMSNHESTRKNFFLALDTSNDFKVARVIREYIKRLDESVDDNDAVNTDVPHFKKIFDKNPNKQERFQVFKTFITDTKNLMEILTKTEVQIMGHILKYPFVSLDSANVEEMYHTLIQGMGVEVDDKKTWTTEMYLLYYFRAFKKVYKNLSTYINGSVGRGSVWVVDKILYESGQFAPRKRKYSPISSDERYVLQLGYGINNAITKRWKAPIHTLPWSCLTGDTKIPLLDGRVISIKDMIDKEDLWVYSYDINRKEIAPGKVLGAKCTGQNAPVYKVSLDNGESFNATAEHLILTKEGYKPVSDLTSGTSLLHFEYKIDVANKIVSVEFLGYEDVYDIEVEKYHNFALEAGVFVHNSELRDTHQTRFSDGIILHIDYAQQEMRMLAAVSQDPDMIAAFESGQDIHRVIAAKVWGKAPEDVTDAERRYSKMCCIHGDTKIKLLNGTSKKVKDLVNQSGFQVYSYDIKNNKEVVGYANDCQLTKKTKNYVKVYINSENYLIVTLEHRFLMEDGLYIFAKDLKSNELLMSLNNEISKVTRVEFLEFEDEQDFYDLSVLKYHNYAIELSDGSSVFTHNSFSLIYGKSIAGVANDFLNGDMRKAEELFESFYGGFPQVKVYFENKEKELFGNGFVTSMFGDRIFIDFNPANKGSVSKAIRATKNYPIQHAGSTLAGLGIQYMMDEIGDTSEIRPYGFTHDSTDIDMRIEHIPRILNLGKVCMVDRIKEEFNVPVDIDIEVGLRGNSMIETDIIPQEKESHFKVEFKGEKNSVISVVSRLKEGYHISNFEFTEEVEDYNSMSELFITRRAYSRALGQSVMKTKGHFDMVLRG